MENKGSLRSRFSLFNARLTMVCIQGQRQHHKQTSVPLRFVQALPPLRIPLPALQEPHKVHVVKHAEMSRDRDGDTDTAGLEGHLSTFPIYSPATPNSAPLIPSARGSVYALHHRFDDASPQA